jgi:hypothetical protein
VNVFLSLSLQDMMLSVTCRIHVLSDLLVVNLHVYMLFVVVHVVVTHVQCCLTMCQYII